MIASLPQPFGFYRHLTGSDMLHFGYWSRPDADLREAQQALSDLLLAELHPPPLRVLDVGCGLGVTAQGLSKHGHQVTALAPSAELIAYAEHFHPGPHYLACGLMDTPSELTPPTQYDCIILQESLQYLPDLTAVFAKIRSLLAPNGEVRICDEVSYDSATRAHSSIHAARDIAEQFSQADFVATRHLRIGDNVLPTCRVAVDLFTGGRDELLATFGAGIAGAVDRFLSGWQWQLAQYGQGKLGYEMWQLHLQNS